jgi:thermitase
VHKPSTRVKLVVATAMTASVSVLMAVAAAAQNAAVVASFDATTTDAHVPGHVLVHFAAGTSGADEAALEHTNGASVVGHVVDLGVDVLNVPVGAEQHVIDALQRSGKVQYAELDGVVHAAMTPDDPDWSQQWGLSKMNVTTAWDTTTGLSSVVVADLDTGVDSSQPDLQGKLASGWNFVNSNSNPNDDNGHGTATAGVIGAVTNNGTGIAGSCPLCMVMPVKVLDSTGSGSWSGISNGITWATDHGARILNMSLSSTSDTSTLHNAVQYAASHGAIAVGSAGNNGNTTPVFPAAYPEALSVAGTTSSDGLYSWSDYGSWVEVAAPGCTYATRVGGSYSSFCGTSASAPFVSGVLGLMLSAQPSASIGTLVQNLESTAASIGSAVQYGRVDAAAAIAAAGGPATPAPAPSPSPTPTASTTTSATFGGALTTKTASKSYTVSVGTGAFDAQLTFSKTKSMTIELTDQRGTVMANASGAGPVELRTEVTAGSYTVVVAGSSRASYQLALQYATP